MFITKKSTKLPHSLVQKLEMQFECRHIWVQFFFIFYLDPCQHKQYEPNHNKKNYGKKISTALLCHK